VNGGRTLLGYRREEYGHLKRLALFITEFGSFVVGMGVIDAFTCGLHVLSVEEVG
jgi:hypothetical protein